MIIIYNILGWMLAVILLITFISLCFWVFSGFNNKTRFTSVPRYTFKEIKKILNLKKGDILYNLGSGDSSLLFYLLKQNMGAKYVGVEDNIFLLSLARLHNWWNNLKGKNKIEIINKDFFKQDLPKATHIFTYLYPNTMDDLLPKFDKEFKSGTRLISLNFKFTSKKPILEFELNKKKYQLKHTIYVYEF